MKTQLRALVLSNQEIGIKILNWELTQVATVEEALSLLQQTDYQYIALDDALEDIDKRKLETIAKLYNGDVSIVTFSRVEHLDNSIKKAFRKNRESAMQYEFLDNALALELAGKLHVN